MKARHLMLLLGVAGLGGCQSGARGEVPARLVEPTAETRAELAEVVARALQVSNVTLAHDALTSDSRLIVERRARHDVEHGRIPGRDPGQPEQFRLMMQGARCVLVHAGSGERWVLARARCVPE